MVKISDDCIGCGLCASICSEAFGMEGGKAVVKGIKDADCIDEAIESCPVDAISK